MALTVSGQIQIMLYDTIPVSNRIVVSLYVSFFFGKLLALTVVLVQSTGVLPSLDVPECI